MAAAQTGRRLPSPVVAAALLILYGGATSHAAAQDPRSLETSERRVAIGDIHGAYDQLVEILLAAEIIDNRERWIAGRALLVQTEDILDRGPQSRRALDLLQRLEREAEDGGGRVLALLGNHEAATYGRLSTPRSEMNRDRVIGHRMLEEVIAWKE